jgi:hypothetical protein
VARNSLFRRRWKELFIREKNQKIIRTAIVFPLLWVSGMLREQIPESSLFCIWED